MDTVPFHDDVELPNQKKCHYRLWRDNHATSGTSKLASARLSLSCAHAVRPISPHLIHTLSRILICEWNLPNPCILLYRASVVKLRTLISRAVANLADLVSMRLLPGCRKKNKE